MISSGMLSLSQAASTIGAGLIKSPGKTDASGTAGLTKSPTLISGRTDASGITAGAGLIRSTALNSGRTDAAGAGAGLARSPATNSGRTEAAGISSKVPAMLAALMP